MVSKRLLVIDDDSMLRQTLSEQLRIREEFETYEAATGEAALALLKELNFDIMLMDVGLPDIDGRELCRLIRRQGIKAPIIMLTARDGEADTILGLNAGANDYITKPFKISILLAGCARIYGNTNKVTMPYSPLAHINSGPAPRS